MHHALAGQGRANATGEPKWCKRSETAQVVFKGELGPAAKQSTAGEFFFVFSSCGADVADYTRDAIEWRRERELATYQGIELSSPRRAERIGEQWQSGRSWDGGSVWGILECDAALRRRYLMGRSPFSYAQVLNDIGNGLKYFID